VGDTKTLPADLVSEWRERAAAERRLVDSGKPLVVSRIKHSELALYYEMRADELAAAIKAQGSADPSCWHCGDVLIGPLPKPRCENCPDECDVEGCEAPGCEELRSE
jgi:hypothetical protein